MAKPTDFNIVLEVLATTIRTEKEIKGIQIGKEEGKAGVQEPAYLGPLAEASIRKWEAVFSLLILGYRVGVTESSLFPPLGVRQF